MQLQQEVEDILNHHFPSGLPPGRVNDAAARGDALLITPESELTALEPVLDCA